MIISTPEDTPRFKNFWGDGSKIGVGDLRYAIPRKNLEGIGSKAFLIG